MMLRVKDEQVAWFYALTVETGKMTSGFTFACMLHKLVGLSQRVLVFALTGVVRMHCGCYVSSRTGSCIPLPDKHQLCYW